MIASLISIPVMFLLSVLQSTAISRIMLLNGTADLILLAVAAWGVKERGYNGFLWALVGGLFMSIQTAMPFYVPVISYLFVAVLAKMMFRRIWQSPIIMLIIVVLAGTIFSQGISLLYLQISGFNVNFLECIRSISLPTMLLNFFFIFPMYVAMTDLREWIMPEEEYE
jgi:cell shape-determining protein MreD